MSAEEVTTSTRVDQVLVTLIRILIIVFGTGKTPSMSCYVKISPQVHWGNFTGTVGGEPMG